MRYYSGQNISANDTGNHSQNQWKICGVPGELSYRQSNLDPPGLEFSSSNEQSGLPFLPSLITNEAVSRQNNRLVGRLACPCAYKRLFKRDSHQLSLSDLLACQHIQELKWPVDVYEAILSGCYSYFKIYVCVSVCFV